MKIFKFLIVFVLCFSIFYLVNAEEQTIVKLDQNQSSEMVLVNDVSIENAEIISQNGNSFKLSFNLLNKGEIIGDVKYGVKLVGENNNKKFIADEKAYEEKITLYTNDNINKTITYEAPSLTSGEYYLYITSRNSNGFVLATSFVSKVEINSIQNNLLIDNSSCYLSISGLSYNVSLEKYSLSEGVDITKSETLSLNCNVINNTTEDLSLTPEYKTTYRNVYGDDVSTSNGDNNTFTLNKGENKQISLILPKAEDSQAYSIEVYLKNENISSNKVIVHYVLSGESATIQNISLDKDFYSTGDVANVSFVWAGRADSFPGSRNSSPNLNTSVIANIQILNDNKSCSDVVEKELFTNYADLEINTSIDITSSCKNPNVLITLKNQDGEVLAENSLNIKSVSNSKISKYLIYGIVLIIIILLIVFYLIKKRKNKKISIPTAIIIGFIIFSIFNIFPHKANAQTLIIGEKNGYYVSVQVNLDDGENYDPGSDINITFSDVEFNACSNAVTNFSLYADDEVVFENQSEDDYLINTITLKADDTPGEHTISLSGSLTTLYSGSIKKTTTSTGSISYVVNGDGVCSSDHYNCEAGESSDVILNGTYKWGWYCYGYGDGEDSYCTEDKVTTDGLCGSGHYNCSSGTSSDNVNDNGNYTWTCEGIAGGEDASCSENISSPVCGETHYNCDVGTSVGGYQESYDYWAWYCSTDVSRILCKEDIITPDCGSDKFSCDLGVVTHQIEDSENATWWCTCDGTDCNYYSTSCTFNKPIDGICNTYSLYCDQGVYEFVSDDGVNAVWQCLGQYDGEDVTCSLDRNTDMYGELSGTNCTIAADESSCYASVSWNTYNPEIENGSEIISSSGTLIASGDSGSSVKFSAVKSIVLYLYNNAKVLATHTFSNSCVSGYRWSNNKCSQIINGGWTDWTPVKDTCGITYTQTRTCTNPTPSNGGSNCSSLDGGKSSRTVTNEDCPEDNSVVIDGPTEFYVNTEQDFTLSLYNPSWTKVTYYIDWDNDGTQDEKYPSGSSYGVSTSSTPVVSYTWTKTGTYTFEVLAYDYYSGTKSDWTTYKVKVITDDDDDTTSGDDSTTDDDTSSSDDDTSSSSDDDSSDSTVPVFKEI